MPWYKNIVPESIKKNVCAYLLQRYLGQFFEEKLTIDQLNVDLYNGTGTVEKISLDVQALNELGEKQNWPMEFVDGYIEKLYLSIPWTSILKDPSFVEVVGLKITVQPKQRHESATSMFESMWNSMTSSMQLAEECAKQDAANAANTAQPYEGIELFAQTIDSILSRVKVKFIDTIVQVEHVPKDSSTGVGVVINIGLIEYSDEAGNDPTNDEAADLTSQESKKAYLVQSFTTKKFIIQNVSLSTVEFSSKARTFSRSVLSQSQHYDSEKDSFVTLLEKTDLKEEEQGLNQESEENGTKTPTQEVESMPDIQPNQLDGHRHVILFGKFSSKQEIRVRLKQSENLTGPKVSIEVNLGSLIMFLSPRQFHVLMELSNGLASPDIEDTSNVAPRTKYVAKPMTGLDYHRVEQELQQQLQPLANLHVGGLQGHQGWSSAPLDESDTEESFLPLKNAMKGMYDSTLSGISSSMESSITSSMASSVTEQSSRTRKRINNIDADPMAEISHFQIRLGSLALILLHEDLLIQPTESDQILAPSSVQQMQQTVANFFENLGSLVLTAYGNKDFEIAKATFEKACNLNHLRLLAAPVQIEGNEKTTLSAFSISGQLFAAKVELLECLYKAPEGPVEYVPLLTFTDTASIPTTSPTTAKPNLKLSFKHVVKTSRNGASRRNSGPKTDVAITLNNCTVELDITLIDRITALLNVPNICIIDKPAYNPWNTGFGSSEHSLNTPSDSRMDLKVTSPSLTLKLRFPIPDFRPPHDMNRLPWWKRNVRPDYLSLELSEALLQSTFQTTQSFQEYIVQCRGIDVFYYETENSVGLPIAKAGTDDKYPSSMQSILQQSKLSIKVFPTKKQDLFDSTEQEQDPMGTSFYGAFENQSNKQPGPFSAKKVVHESDTPHSKPQDDAEELLIPGDKHELDEFIKSTMICTKIQVEVLLPTLSVQLKSKHIYELIYNRINNDLLLWEPSAPKPKNNLYEKTTYPNYVSFGNNFVVEGQDTFAMCKSGIQYESESESDEESEGSRSTIFYSVYENRMKIPTKGQISETEVKNKGQSYIVLNLQIGQGLLCMNPPVRDVATNNVIPGQQGEFLLNVEDANIFIVNGYKGDENLGYVCVQVNNAQLNHCDMISIPSLTPPLKEIGTAVGRHLHPAIHKSEVGMLANAKNRGGEREMLTVAVKIQANHETHHVKTVQVGIGVNKGTLRHRMCNEPNSWISHMLDFFNVQDYPIPGYHAKDVLTELHLHLWDCAIDYRPLHMPIRCAITVGNFSMSSHLSAQANSSTLRFIFEECGLFLSEKAPPRNGVASSAPVDLKRDYVNIIELGLFELSLKTNDKKSGINPHIDLRISNNIVNIHTCADSGKALMQLITYFANDGDIISSSPVMNEKSPFSSPRHQVEHELVSVEPQDISNLSKSQHEHVNDLLGEAMKESEILEGDGELLTNTGEKVFFFPDEHQILQEVPGNSLTQIPQDVGDVAYHSNKSSDTDDDFCFVGNEAGLGMFPKSGHPEIKWLTSDPVRVVDNHFSIPVGKTDLLKPPKHFPTPIMRYTLCEMTIIWHMYGGNDFKVPEQDTKKKTVNFSDTQLNDTVSFSNTSRGEVNIMSNLDKKKINIPWILKGGVNRDHNVLMELQLNKVRFQHEVYPETTIHASRQVLIISEVEIRDRLESSQINKFLYEYTSQARPKQSHAHMVVIKAIHIRPDPKLKTQECCLRVSLLPLRLNIDQDALLFLITFFHELGGGNCVAREDQQSTSSKHNTPTHQPPVMTISQENEDMIKQQAHKVVNENLILLIEENRNQQESIDSVATSSSSVSDSSPVYFRNVIFSPDVPIRLDYHGKRVDMTHGSLPGLLMGLGQLNCSELRLKRISYRHGLLGFDKLMTYLLQEWLSDIKKNQLPSLLGGVGPMYSLVQLFQGVRDLFWLPIEQYQKDGRIVRGLQRGANSFTTSTAMAALELTSRIIHLIQITAETAYDMLSPGPSVRRVAKSKGRRKRYHQPQDIREGMTNAYRVVKEVSKCLIITTADNLIISELLLKVLQGIGETSDDILQVVSREKEQKGYSGVVGVVLRQIPPTILKPVIIASEATSNVLGGMRSQLVPDARREANQKWRSDDV